LFQRRLPQTFKHATLHDAKQGVGIVQARKFSLGYDVPNANSFPSTARLAASVVNLPSVW
jgi:hypothetical protein